jgi:hypothetical protein
MRPAAGRPARLQRLRGVCRVGCALGLWLALLLLVPAAASAGQWLTPLSVPAPEWPTTEPGAGSVAGDARGNVIAAISGGDRSGGVVGAMSWAEGQAPGVPQRLSSAGRHAWGARVVVDRDGNASLAWIEQAEDKTYFMSARKPAAEVWQAPQTTSMPAQGISGLRFAMSVDGLVVAAWSRRLPRCETCEQQSVVEAAVKPVGTSAFGPVLALSEGFDGYGASPDVAVDPSGNAVVVWDGDGNIHAAARPAGGSFAPVGVVAAGSGPRVVMDGRGHATAIWQFGAGLRAAERGTSGDFGAVQGIPGESIGGILDPQLMVDRDGNAVLVWAADETDDSSTNYVVRWAARSPGGSFGAPRKLSTATYHRQIALAMAPDGTAMVTAVAWAWGAGSALQSSVRPPGGSFGSPQDLTRYQSTDYPAHTLGFDGTGDAIAMWREGAGLRAARYDHEAPTRPEGNLIYNSGFEHNLGEWNTSGSTTGVLLTREAGGRSGEWAAKLTNTSTTAGTCALNDVRIFRLTTAPGTYTASLWVRAATAGQTLRLRLREYSTVTGALLGSQSTPVTLTTAWQQTSLTYAPAAPGDSMLDLNAYVPGAAPGTCFFADDASIEHAPPPPPPPPDPGLVANGWFETDLAGWNTSGSAAGVVLTREPGGHSGEWAAKLTNTATTAGTCTLNDAPNAVATTAPGSYAATLWVRSATPGQILRLRLREYAKSGGALLGSHSTPLELTTSWQQVKVTYTPAAPGASTLDLNAYVSGAPPGTCFLADDASLPLDTTPPPPDPNLVLNTGFESSLSGWNASGSAAGVVLTRETGGHTGAWAAKVANTATTLGTCTLNDAPNVIATTAAGTYTASLWVRAEAAGQTLRLRLREYNGSTLVGSQATPITLTTGWQHVAVSYTPAAPGSTTLDLNAYISGASPGTCFLADDAAIHKT